jgi:hypothetical protein
MLVRYIFVRYIIMETMEKLEHKGRNWHKSFLWVHTDHVHTTLDLHLLVLYLMPYVISRWHIFKPKILIWVYTRGTCHWRCWYILLPLIYLTAIWYIMRPCVILCCHFGILCDYLYTYFMVNWYIFPVLVCWTNKNLATLIVTVQLYNGNINWDNM